MNARVPVVAVALSALACMAGESRPRHVFLFIGDGMSTPQRMVAEEFSMKSGRGPLAMNALPYQANTRTKSTNAIITDSAAAATAIACGCKTANGTLGLDGSGNRVESVAEAAKRRGCKVGIMTTVAIVHATPAGFYAHRRNRGQYYQIALDLLDSGFDYFAGAGVYSSYDDRKCPEYRGNVFDLARAAGYAVTSNRADWAALRPGRKAWSRFNDHAMKLAIDSDGSQPTLEDMLRKCLELFGDSPFFIMCEGGEIDHSGHANDAATNLREVIALDDAVKAALEFQDAHPADTLVVVTGDHETGGLSMGFAGIGGKFRPELLVAQKVSVGSFSEAMKKRIRAADCKISFEEVVPDVERCFGLKFVDDGSNDPLLVTAADVKAMKAAFAMDVEKVRIRLQDTTAHDVARKYVFAQAVKNVLNAHAGIGWGSGAHTAMPTLTTAKGPGAEMLVGMGENSDIGARLKRLYE